MSKSTSRRAVLAGAVTIPIAAAVTAPASAETEVAVLQQLGTEVKAAYDDLGFAIDAYGEVGTRLFQWRDSNLEPDKESSAWIEWLQREVAFRSECGCDAAEPQRVLRRIGFTLP
jgi:hypothetical protein